MLYSRGENPTQNIHFEDAGTRTRVVATAARCASNELHTSLNNSYVKSVIHISLQRTFNYVQLQLIYEYIDVIKMKGRFFLGFFKINTVSEKLLNKFEN